ncbi:hypothetical protein D3C78_767180 [compost metagenome]
MNIVSPQFPPGCEQRIRQILNAFFIEKVSGTGTVFKKRDRVVFEYPTPLSGYESSEPAGILNIAPVMSTRVSKQNVDIDMLAQRFKCIEIYGRQRRDSADKHARG